MEHFKNTTSVKSVLSIAGFDNIGGAGLQADIKTISALGCYAMSIITSLPIQNTKEVKKIYTISDQSIKDQLEIVFEDITPDAIKIGVLPSVKQVEIVANFLKNYKSPIIIDPVMISSSGQSLVSEEIIQASKTMLFPKARLITPNLNEVEVLTGFETRDLYQMEQAGNLLLETGLSAILIKGGHLNSARLTNILFQENAASQYFHTDFISSKNTRGTGCTLSSAIASFLALDYELSTAVKHAIKYVEESIKHAVNLDLGKGNGAMNHFFAPVSLQILNK